jgi:hypothetical protein
MGWESDTDIPLSSEYQMGKVNDQSLKNYLLPRDESEESLERW